MSLKKTQVKDYDLPDTYKLYEKYIKNKNKIYNNNKRQKDESIKQSKNNFNQRNNNKIYNYPKEILSNANKLA